MAQIVTGSHLYSQNKLSSDFRSDKEMIDLYWSLLQLEEDTKEVKVPLDHLSFIDKVNISDLSPDSFYRLL